MVELFQPYQTSIPVSSLKAMLGHTYPAELQLLWLSTFTHPDFFFLLSILTILTCLHQLRHISLACSRACRENFRGPPDILYQTWFTVTLKKKKLCSVLQQCCSTFIPQSYVILLMGLLARREI